MSTPKISIIVPVYNMELYLRECLDSIKDQTFKDWECIIVDDGSTDRSPEICDEYQNMDSRFKVIHKENGGVSSARNTGLRNASGDTIGFVDPDDYTDPSMFEYLYNLMTEYDADISQMGYWEEYKDYKKAKQLSTDIIIIDNKTSVFKLFTGELPDYLWNKLHKRSIITGEFPEGRKFEDIAVYGEWLKNVKKMVIGPGQFYHYRMRKGSIVHTEDNMYDYFKSNLDRVNMIESFFGKDCYSDEKNTFIYDNAIIAGKTIARFEKDESKRKELITYISNQVERFPNPNLSNIGLRKWVRSMILKYNPDWFAKWMRFSYLFNINKKLKNNNLYD